MNRREALRTLAAGGATGSLAAGVIVATTPAPAHDASDIARTIETELSAYRLAWDEESGLLERYGAIYDALPAWVQSGPSELNSDGTKGGRSSGGPEAADLTPPPAGEKRIIRQTLREYWTARNHLLKPCGEFIKHPDGSATITAAPRLSPVERRAIRLETIAGMRRLIVRQREADAIKEASGIRQITEAMNACNDECNTIEARVVSLATGSTLPEIGVQALFGHRAEESEFTATLLRQLLPHLEGVLREFIVAELADYERRNGEA